MKKLLLALAFIPTILFSQSRKERKALQAQQKADQQVIGNLKGHIQHLTNFNTPVQANAATDLAIQYISNQFKAIGLQPKGTNGYIQPFTYKDGKQIESSTYLKVNGATLELKKDYFPLSCSAEKTVTGMPAMALREKGVPWFADVKDWLEETSKTAGFNINELIRKEVAKDAAKGATALFLYNTGSATDSLSYSNNDNSQQLAIPVVYIRENGYKKYFNDHSQILDVELNVAFKEINRNGNNVIGYINNNAPTTIVIGAHYENAASENKSTPDGSFSPIKADDNGSGVALIIELSKMLSTAKSKTNNFLFIAFGGADKGLHSSRYWINNPTVSVPINYVINLDMVGSYDQGKKLMVEGYNSSPEWSEILASITDKKLDISLDSIDQFSDSRASFYQKNIPVLSFSTSKHENYYEHSDEENKINYEGELQLAKFISKLVAATGSKGKLTFAEKPDHISQSNNTAETQKTVTKTVAPTAVNLKNTVSLGVIPDKINDASGLRISGVSPKKLASKIGLQSGDVLTDLGSYKISNLKSYMQALSNFKTGDKTMLRIKRGKDDKEFEVEF